MRGLENLILSVLTTISFLSFINNVGSARILCVFQMAAVSHHQVFQPIWKELSLRGHQVVVVTPYPLKDPGNLNTLRYNFVEIVLDWKISTKYLNFLEICNLKEPDDLNTLRHFFFEIVFDWNICTKY